MYTVHFLSSLVLHFPTLERQCVFNLYKIISNFFATLLLSLYEWNMGRDSTLILHYIMCFLNFSWPKGIRHPIRVISKNVPEIVESFCFLTCDRPHYTLVTALYNLTRSLPGKAWLTFLCHLGRHVNKLRYTIITRESSWSGVSIIVLFPMGWGFDLLLSFFLLGTLSLGS